MRFLNDEQREKVGFKYILDELEVITPFGKDEKRNLKSFNRQKKDQLLLELDNISKVVKAYEKSEGGFNEIISLFKRIKDIRGSLRKCLQLQTLDDVEFFEIKGFCIILKRIICLYNSMELSIKSITFTPPQQVIDILSPKGEVSATFCIYDRYSDVLKKIRSRKRLIESQIYLCREDSKLKELSEQRLESVIEEENEELIIRERLTREISFHAEDILKNINNIGKLDFTIAKALLAIRYKAVRPEIADNRIICFKGAVNPEVVQILQNNNKAFTPVNLEIKSGTTVITGANMGGKSIALRTILLNLLLGSMGFFVFAEAATMSILDFIYLLSDDNQSAVHGLSTFGGEIMALKEALQYVKSGSGFIALDEFARGTNPKEGSHLVKSICKYLNSFNSYSLIATHYDGISDATMVHYEVRGLKNIDFGKLKERIKENSRDNLEAIQELMDYRLEKVSYNKEVPKDALNISILLGLEEDLIDIIKGYYNEDDCLKGGDYSGEKT